jgi:hypothetical protein
MDYHRRQKDIPEVAVPFKEAFEAVIFIEAGSDFPHIDAAAGKKD